MKRQISLILVLLFALAALQLGVLAAGNDYRYATEPVNMRTGPGTQYDVIRELQTDEQVEYLKRSGKWAKVKSGDTEGYVFAKYLTREKPIAAGTVLAFARAMGEFGATLFCAGNYAGITQTMPIAIYFQWMGGNTDVAIFWVIVVIFISFLVILFINVYTAHSQRYRKGGLTRAELKMLKKQGRLAGEDSEGANDDQSFSGIHAADAETLFERVSTDEQDKARG